MTRAVIPAVGVMASIRGDQSVASGKSHYFAEIGRAYAFARSLQFPQINIDLIAGMMDETPDNWERCVRTAIEQQPDCVTIYQMEIPLNTTIYAEMRQHGQSVAPVA